MPYASDLCHYMDGDHLEHGFRPPEIGIQLRKEWLPDEEVKDDKAKVVTNVKG